MLCDSIQKFTAELEATGEFSGSGAAAAEFSAEKFTLTLSTHDLPELSEPEFYEGWLMRVEPFDQISLGKLVPKEEGDALTLSLETPENLTDYTRVSVTFENEGNTKTILEGVFEEAQ